MYVLISSASRACSPKTALSVSLQTDWVLMHGCSHLLLPLVLCNGHRVAKLLRIFMMLVIQTYFVAGLSLLLTSVDCRLAGTIPHGQTHDTLGPYPAVGKLLSE